MQNAARERYVIVAARFRHGSLQLIRGGLMRVRICGGREYNDCGRVWCELSLLHAQEPFTLVICGGARGVDAFALLWAETHDVPSIKCCARWDGVQAADCLIQSFEVGNPDLVIAFPGGPGTARSVTQAQSLRIRMVIID